MSAATRVELGIVVRGAGRAPPAPQLLEELLARIEVKIEPVDAGIASEALVCWRRFGKGRHPAGLNYGDTFSYRAGPPHGCPTAVRRRRLRSDRRARRLTLPTPLTEPRQKSKPLAATGRVVMPMSGGPSSRAIIAGMAACMASLPACCWAASMLDIEGEEPVGAVLAPVVGVRLHAVHRLAGGDDGPQRRVHLLALALLAGELREHGNLRHGPNPLLLA